MSMDFATVWEAISDALGGETALVHGDARRSWRAFDDRAARIATAFSEAGLGPDSKIALYMYNSNEYLEAHYAAFKMRGVAVNVNYRYLEDELVYLFDNADAEAVVYHASFAPTLAAVRGRLPKLRLLIQVDEGAGAPLLPGARDYEAVIADEPPMPRIARSDEDIYMLYTGGTTGLPKGVMRHVGTFCRGLLAGYQMLGEAVPESPAEAGEAALRLRERGLSPIALAAPPLMHGTGLWLGGFAPLNQGGTVVTLANRRFDPDELWRTVERDKVTNIVIVGDAFAKPMLRALEAAEEAGRPYDISSVRAMTSSGVMWSHEVKKGLLSRGDMVLRDAMGSTEGGMASQIATRDNIMETGKFQLNENCKVFTDDDREVRPGSDEIGRIATAGNVPIGYYKDEKKTAETFRVIDGVRYAFPGDYAQVEADGTITLLGRGSYCINSGGEKIYPEEVEEAVKTHPAIEDCLVVGVPDERFGERVVAVVAAIDGVRPDESEILAALEGRIARFKLPRQIVVAPRIERAPNGKADYKWAKATALDAVGEAGAA